MNHFVQIMSHTAPENDEAVLLEKKTRIEEPRLYKVLLHNDDYTTMDFVVFVLTSLFHKSMNDATQIMLNVHHNGVGIAGVYTREICEMKIALVHSLAEENEFPLRCTMEIT